MRNIKKRVKSCAVFASTKVKKCTRFIKRVLSKKNNLGYKFAYPILALVAIYLLIGLVQFITRPNYVVSAAAQKLIGSPDVTLANAGLKYSKKSQVYTLNGSLIGNKVEDDSIRIGGGNSASYSFTAPTNLNSHAITYYDDLNDLSFGLKPNFKTATGHYSSGQFVYPINRHEQDVYDVKANGLEENVVVYKPVGDKANLTYTLDLPSTLQARLMPSGDVGIYSASPVLFGNVSAASASDQKALAEARQNGQKNYLEFVLAAPSVRSQNGSAAKASLELKGSTLTVNVSDLANISYPISIDPSVVVSSANPFTGGNDDSNIDVGSGSIQTNYITGGDISSWSSATAYSGTAREYMASTVYNGVIYTFGGYTGSAYSSTIECGTISSSSPGTITWSSVSSPSGLSAEAGATMVAYDGYLYVVGGYNGTSYSSSVYYASISSGICGSSPTSWTTASIALTSTREYASAVAYDGYLYVVGGTNGSPDSDINYAAFNGNGSLTGNGSGLFNDKTSELTTATAGGSAFAYNNFLYYVGGATGSGAGTAASTSYYCPINSGGSGLGSCATTTSLPANQDDIQAVVNSGYVYVYGGMQTSLTSNSPLAFDSYFAPIFADGQIGTWTSTSAVGTAGIGDSMNVVYNGYLYSIGGYSSSSIITSSYYSAISVAGSINTGSTTGLPLYAADGTQSTGGVDMYGLYLPSVVVYDSWIYVIGGCFQSGTTSNGAACNSNYVSEYIFYAPICTGTNITGNSGTDCNTSSTPGTIGSWTNSNNLSTPFDITTHNVYGAPAVGFNNIIYQIGGCLAAGVSPKFTVCNNVGQGYNSFQVNSYTGVPSTLLTQTTPAYKQFGGAAVVYGGNLYLVGGCNANSVGAEWDLCGDSGTNYTSAASLGGTSPVGTAAQCWYWPVSGVYPSSSTSTQELGDGSPCTNSYNGATDNIGADLPPFDGGTTAGAYGVFGEGYTENNGYIYLIGGCMGNTTTTTNQCYGGSTSWNFTEFYGKLNSGSITWYTETPSYSSGLTGIAPRLFTGSYVYNGYIYLYGGCSNWSVTVDGGCTSGGVLNDIYSAPLDPVTGAIGKWSIVGVDSPDVTATPAASGSLTASTTYYYKVTAVVDGIESPGIEVSAATTSSNKTIDLSWNAISVSGQSPSTTTYNVYSSTTAGAEHWLATTTSTSYNDTAVPNSTGNSPPTGLGQAWGMGSSGQGASLFMIGGCSGSPTSDAVCQDTTEYSPNVYSAQLNAGGSPLGPTWYSLNTTSNVTGSPDLSSAITQSTSIIYNNNLYVIGGYAESSGVTDCTYNFLNAGAEYWCNEIFDYSLSTTGVPSLTATYTFAGPGPNIQATAANGYLYIFADADFSGNSVSTTNTTPTCSNNWGSVLDPPDACQATYDSVQVAQISSSGTLSAPSSSNFTTITGYSTSYLSNTMFNDGTRNESNYAGTCIAGNVCAAVSYPNNGFPSNSSGCGTFQNSGSDVVWNGYIYFECNYYINWVTYDDGYETTINSTVSWVTPNSPADYLMSVKINANGTLGNASFITLLGNTDSGYNTLKEYNGYLYYTPSVGNLQYAKLTNSGGLSTLSSFSDGTIDAATGTIYGTPNIDGNLLLANGYAYFFGGYISEGIVSQTGCENSSSSTNSNGGYCNGIWVAPINSDGSFGAFSWAGVMPTSFDNGQETPGYLNENNGIIYLIDGSNNSTSPSIDPNIEWMATNSIAHVGQYSYLANASYDVTPIGAVITGDNTNGDTQNGPSNYGNLAFSYSFGQSSADSCSTAFGTTYTYRNTPMSNLLPTSLGSSCSSQNTLAQYEYITLQIDDSSIFTFPDSYELCTANPVTSPATTSTTAPDNCDHTSVSNISLYYHPSSGSRLTQGGTLTNGVKTSLDAPP